MQTALSTKLHMGFEDAVARTTEALKSEGFGVLTEVDVQNTLKQKLGVEMRPYRILGACNPPFANQALQLNADAGLLMPCNVVVYESASGEIVVSAVDPQATASAFGDAKLAELSGQIREKLVRVISAFAK